MRLDSLTYSGLHTACLVELRGPFPSLRGPEEKSVLGHLLPLSPLQSLPSCDPVGEQALWPYGHLFMRVVPLLNSVKKEYEYIVG